MDVSLPRLVPVNLPDMRPSADAAASARIGRPPAAMAISAMSVPTSLSQEALVARSVLEPSAVAPVGQTSAAFGEAPKRVLKPWGILMLPVELQDDRTTQGSETTETATEELPSPSLG